MKCPITEDFLREYESKIEKETGNPISPNRREHAEIVTRLINEAYVLGYSDGLQAVMKGESK